MRQGFLGQFLPHDLTDQASVLLARTLAFSALCSVVIGLYSCIKWGRLGNDALMYGSLLLVLGMPLMLLVLRSAVLPLAVAANMALACMASYSMLLIYQLGGLHSAHIYWPAVIIVFAYLLAGTRSAMLWSLVQVLFVFWLIRLERSGASLPVFELSPRDAAVNTYSGYVLPALTVWLAQWYSAQLRNQALADAEQALSESREFGQRAARNQEQLGGIVDEVRSTASDLLQMAGQLQQTIGGIRQRCQSIDTDVQQQADAMHHLDLALHKVLDSLAASTGHMQQLSEDTQHSSSQVNACAQRMEDAQASMQAIQQSNQRIAESMQMISAIAQQTNLLALNAAIEAARAGDHGRGFAVVADEVRNLSQRSNETADTVQNVLDQSQQIINTGAAQVSDVSSALSSNAGLTDNLSNSILQHSQALTQAHQQLLHARDNSSAQRDASQRQRAASSELLNAQESLVQLGQQLEQLSHQLHQRVARA
ncbi:methyl-accepting chemotaxis protein [Pseudomonas anguilliseptica]|uniref:Methyl-accepting chemotaxis protein (MCP) signalling domain-containing protein n=1 Tax=Pseudomonas anguilliseptica TaxID=53406 RepID=A0A1H5ESX4_PSEAG|nr:methyl-accepting chemotaxis protein [Pseudomonas anguilliseptica]SED94221.1 Methyl-accepting chemotaxis protein (MCP) signalling domain-containing protein [Pseudomonas anguilliseptica]